MGRGVGGSGRGGGGGASVSGSLMDNIRAAYNAASQNPADFRGEAGRTPLNQNIIAARVQRAIANSTNPVTGEVNTALLQSRLYTIGRRAAMSSAINGGPSPARINNIISDASP